MRECLGNKPTPVFTNNLPLMVRRKILSLSSQPNFLLHKPFHKLPVFYPFALTLYTGANIHTERVEHFYCLSNVIRLQTARQNISSINSLRPKTPVSPNPSCLLASYLSKINAQLLDTQHQAERNSSSP